MSNENEQREFFSELKIEINIKFTSGNKKYSVWYLEIHIITHINLGQKAFKNGFAQAANIIKEVFAINYHPSDVIYNAI